MLYKTNLVTFLGTISILGCLSTMSVAMDSNEELAANYKRAALDYPEKAQEYNEKALTLSGGKDIQPGEVSFGLFEECPQVAFKLLANTYLDIQSVARLEESSVGMSRMIHDCVSYNGVTWSDVKRTQIPHQLNIPWPQLYEARSALIEAKIAKCEVDISRATPLTREAKNSFLRNARDFLERACLLGDRQAIGLRIGALANGTFGYTANIELARAMNEALIEQGCRSALYRKLYGRMNPGNRLYDNNIIEALLICRELSNQGDNEAIFHELTILINNQEFPRVVQLVDQLVEEGNPIGIRKKVEGLSHFGNSYYCGYDFDPVAAQVLNERFVQQRDTEAISRKVFGLYYGREGYTKNPEEARTTNEFHANEGDLESIKRRIEGLAEGKFGYSVDHVKAREENERLISQGNLHAIWSKLFSLAGEITAFQCYEKNPAAAKQLIESLCKQGLREAAEEKFRCLLNGRYGFDKNIEEAYKVAREWFLLDV